METSESEKNFSKLNLMYRFMTDARTKRLIVRHGGKVEKKTTFQHSPFFLLKKQF